MTWWSTLAAIVWPASIAMIVAARLGVGGWLSRAGLAVAFGLGITSIAFFLWRLLSLPLSGYPVFELVGMVVAIVWVFISARRVQRPRPMLGSSPSGPKWSVALARIALLIVVGSTIVLVQRRAVHAPNGDWDAWAIWNLRAAFLAANDHWMDGFTPALAWSHPDYPLLMPASLARLWTLTGTGDVVAPLAFAFAVLLATFCVVGGSLFRVGGVVAMTCGVALLLVPEYIAWATSQCADVALGLFMVTAFTLLLDPRDRRTIMLAGIAAGLVAWTKNEGLVVAIAMATALTSVAWWRGRAHAARHQLLPFAIGVLPVLLVVVVFRTVVAPPSDLLAGIAAGGMADKLTDLDRHRTVATMMVDYTFRTWGWWPWAGPASLAVAWTVVGAWRWRAVPDAMLTTAIALIITLLAYYAVYVLTPYELVWHVSSSWPRLLAQLWPSIVWLAVASVYVNTTATPSAPQRDAALA